MAQSKSLIRVEAKRGREYSAAREANAMTKQPNNIQKLPNGRYRARYFAGYDGAGKRIYPSCTFDLQADAKDWLKSRGAGRDGDASAHNCTVGELLDKWLEANHEIRENSRRTYNSQIEQHVKPYIGKLKLRKLDAQKIEAWQSQLLNQGVCKATINGARSRLSSACDAAVRWNWRGENPVDKAASVGQGAAREPRHLTVIEAQRFIEVCQGDPDGLLFELSIRTGLRFAEVAGLTWRCMELQGERGKLRVERTILRVPGGAWKWNDPKSKRGRRRVTFPPETAARLSDHRRTQLEQQLKAGPLWRNHDLVFTDVIGDALRYNTMRVKFRNLLAAAGLPLTITMHKMRHFFAWTSFKSGTDVQTVSREMGHARASFTLDHYGDDPNEEIFDIACDRRDQLLRHKQ